MFDDDTTHFFESGCALIVAVVTDDGAPHATRGWGLDIVGDGRVRVLVDADEPVTLAGLADGRPVAITGSSVRTLRSLQLKGRAERLTQGTDADAARKARFCDAFWSDVEEIHGTPRYLLDRMTPPDVASVEVVVEQVFNQTPGPSAGCAVDTR
jgi:hypothetical protein